MINQQQGTYGNLHGLLRWIRPASVTKGAPSSESETSAIHRSTAARMSLVARLYVLKSSDRKRLQSIRGYMQQVTSHRERPFAQFNRRGCRYRPSGEAVEGVAIQAPVLLQHLHDMCPHIGAQKAKLRHGARRALSHQI